MPQDDILIQLKEVRTALGKENEALGQRIDKAITAAETGTTERAALRKELDALKERADSLATEHDSFKKSARMQLLRQEGLRDEAHGFFIVGAGIREKFATRGVEIDGFDFADGERDALKQFRDARATMLESGATTGSYVVPTAFSVDMIDAIEQAEDLVSDADVVMNLPGNLDFPTIVSRPQFNHKRSAKSAALSKSAPAFGQAQIRPEEGSICFDIDNQLIAMSPIDLGRLFVQLMNEAVSGGLSYDLAYGDGTDSFNSITGFMKVSNAADLYVLPAGKMAFSDVAYQDFYSVVAKPFQRCSNVGRWYMGRDMLGVVANIDCTGKVPLIRYDNGGRLLVDRPIRFAQDFPGIAASAKNTAFMAFGDMKGYLVGIKGVPDISFSEHARHEYNQTQARLVLYYDIKRKHTQAMCAVKTANV